MGFGPQLVDLDGDGHNDLVSGDWTGRIILFRGAVDASFLPGQPINDREGEPIKIDYGVYSFAHDWDADGDFDLLAGTVDATGKGNVYLVTNDGTPTAYKFSKPVKVMAAGQEIVARKGDAAPVAADWDGDGKPDLIIGCGDGSVIWYRNTGSRQSPELSTPKTLLPAPEEHAERGVRSKVCVTDWNEDGQLDLLIGDFGKQFKKLLSEEEIRWRDDARRHQEQFLSTWANTFREYRDLLRQSSANNAETSNELEAKLAKTRERLVELKTLRTRYYEEEQALEPGKQYHGHVWLYLGKKTITERTVESQAVAKVDMPIDEPTANRPIVIASHLSPSAVKPGSVVTLTIRVKTATNWHIYAVDGLQRTGVPTKFALELPSDLTARGEWVLPKAEVHLRPEPCHIYQGDVTFRCELTVSPTASPGKAEVKCMVTYQACDESLCLPPTTIKLSATFEVVSD